MRHGTLPRCGGHARRRRSQRPHTGSCLLLCSRAQVLRLLREAGKTAQGWSELLLVTDGTVGFNDTVINAWKGEPSRNAGVPASTSTLAVCSDTPTPTPSRSRSTSTSTSTDHPARF